MRKSFSFIFLLLVLFLKTNSSLAQGLISSNEKKACKNFYTAIPQAKRNITMMFLSLSYFDYLINKILTFNDVRKRTETILPSQAPLELDR